MPNRRLQLISSIIQSSSINEQHVCVENTALQLFTLIILLVCFRFVEAWVSPSDDLKLFKYWFFIDCLASECNFDSNRTFSTVSSATMSTAFATQFSAFPTAFCIIYPRQSRSEFTHVVHSRSEKRQKLLKFIEAKIKNWKIHDQLEKCWQESRYEFLRAHMLLPYLMITNVIQQFYGPLADSLAFILFCSSFPFSSTVELLLAISERRRLECSICQLCEEIIRMPMNV